MSLTTTAPSDLRERLQSVQAAITEARNERAANARALDQARAGVARLNVEPAKLTSAPAFKSAERAQETLRASEAKLNDLQEAERGLLTMLGGSRPQSDGSVGALAGNGWALAARELDLPGGRTRVDMPAADLLRSPAFAAVGVTPSSSLTAPAIEAPFMQRAQDRRFLYPVFARANAEDGDLAITEFRQVGSRTVTGTVERDPVATTEKAQLGLSIELVTPSLRQFAAVVDEVPSKLFGAVPALEAFLESELRYQLDLAIDAHVLAQIAAAAPPVGLTGATLIEQARNGVAAMRGLGGNPTVLALNPTDAAALDLQKTGTSGLEQYIFASRDTGSASPLWGSMILEVPNITAPTLIDPALLGVVYEGNGTILVDPYTGMSTNEVRVRVEVDGLFHVRDIGGAYLIEEEGE